MLIHHWIEWWPFSAKGMLQFQAVLLFINSLANKELIMKLNLTISITKYEIVVRIHFKIAPAKAFSTNIF